MAHMIPAEPRDFDPHSHEGVVYESLSRLPDNYYVFHSLTAVILGKQHPYAMRESDFVIVSPTHGLLVIEAKAGQHISYQNGNWFYSNGELMPHKGPYNQAHTAMLHLMNCINMDMPDIKKKLKFLSAVWFMDMPLHNLQAIHLPPEASLALTLTMDDLNDPIPKIESIFQTEVYGFYPDRPITPREFDYLIAQILCPTFHLIPSPTAQNEAIELRFKSLLREQYRLLDFLEEQPTAVINGAAGTGKTMLAVEKARRHSIAGETVLFLCYNRLLCDFLNEQYKNNPDSKYRQQFENVSFMTLSKLAKELINDYEDMNALALYLADCADHPGKLNYTHIIVDEGQDFGMVEENRRSSATGSDNCSVIDFLREVAVENHGTFYLFYDKHQMIQGGNRADYALPECITDSDCRLTLHTNCRNTREIAVTSVTPLRDHRNRSIKVCASNFWGNPIPPCLHLLSDSSQQIPALNRVLDRLKDQEIDNVTILTPQTFDFTALKPFLEGHDTAPTRFYPYRGKRYTVTTCIRFKGLESDAIILMDLRRDTFQGRGSLAFYVGSSRAKYRLDILLTLPEEEYYPLAHELDPNIPNRSRNPERMRTQLGNLFSATVECE